MKVGLKNWHLIIAVMVLSIGIIFQLGCSPEPCECGDCGDPIVYGGNCDITIINPPPNENSLTGVSINLLSVEIVGQQAWLSIFNTNNDSNTVLIEETIVIENKELFYVLEPGNYWLSLAGDQFNVTQEFAVNQDSITEITIQVEPTPTVTWDLVTSSNSPYGLTVFTHDTDLLKFEVSHNWQDSLTPLYYAFSLNNPENQITINTCYLTLLNGQTSTVLGQTQNSCTESGCYIFEFFHDDSTLDLQPVLPGETTTYVFSCDMQAQPGSTLSTSLHSFGFDNPTMLWLDFNNWPEPSYLFNTSEQFFIYANAMTPIGLRTIQQNQHMMYTNVVNDSVSAQTITNLGYQLEYSPDFQVNSCRIENWQTFEVYHTDMAPVFNNGIAYFDFTNLNIMIASGQDKTINLICDTIGTQINAVVRASIISAQGTNPVDDNFPILGGTLMF